MSAQDQRLLGQKFPSGSPFQKGQPANPGGRPKELAGIRELARENAPLIIRTLVDVAENGQSESARVAAANALLDRAFGRPAHVVASDPFEGRSALGI